jgi:hypothetical protein
MKSSKQIRSFFPCGTPVEYDMPFGQPARMGVVVGPCAFAPDHWWVEDDAEGHHIPIPGPRLRAICWIV